MTNPLQWYMQSEAALNRGDWRQAFSLAARVAVHAPSHGGVHFIAGVAGLQLHQFPQALKHLNLAAKISPERVDYLAQYARGLAMTNLMKEALNVADKAMALSSEDGSSFNTLGVVYSRGHAHDCALSAFRRAVELEPQHADYRFNLATSFMFYGDIESAEREYEHCIFNDHGFWRAHLGLSQMRKQTLGNNHIGRLESLLVKHGQNIEAQLYLNIALGKECEDLGEHVKAFDFYVRGKSVHRKNNSYSIEYDAQAFAAITRYFAEPRAGQSGFDSTEPIFIIGMPRTGTTLLDRIVSAHSAVHSAGELHNFGIALQRAFGRPVSRNELLLRFDPHFSEWSRLGSDYIQSTRHVARSTPYFTDKLPHNFLYAGFIAHALPKARIICLRRDPMDTCLSNFRQLFAEDSADHQYSFDLLDTGRYYLLFDKLMRHWQRVLPGRILEVNYEDIVKSQERVTREILSFCELPWEDACLHFSTSEAPVATASAVHVRSPISSSSVRRWKLYKERLDELRHLLEDGDVLISEEARF